MSATPHVGSSSLVRAVVSLSRPLAFEPRSPTEAGLRYRLAQSRGREPLADVYLPGGPGPHPSVVLVHGGGFVIGSRSMKPMRFLATRLCEAGFAVACFDYRLLFRGARLEGAVDDVRSMLRWWGEQTARFGLDPARISAAGLSAGGTLLLLATSGAPPISLRHLVSVFALYDLAGIQGRLPRLMARLLTKSKLPDDWRRRSPLSQPLCPVPMTLLHGSADTLTPLSLAHDYAALRRAAGLSTRMHTYEGAEHGFFNDARSAVASHALADLLAALSNPAA